MPSRSEALELMQEYTASDSLRKHMLAVEGAMRAYAERFGEDVEEWGLAGLLHDFDYERWPNESHLPDREHPAEGVRILRERGVQEPVLEAILGHATGGKMDLDIHLLKEVFGDAEFFCPTSD
jgi:putative nucleotidyltransferase with HDIG domain